VFFMARGINNLQHLPYNGMRMANITIRLQVGPAQGTQPLREGPAPGPAI
jgi:hypothetical protein